MMYGGPAFLPYVTDACPSCGELICTCPETCVVCGKQPIDGQAYCGDECRFADQLETDDAL